MDFRKYVLKNILIIISIFIFGIIIGAFSISWIEKKRPVTDKLNTISYLIFESEEAASQYFSSLDVDSGIYALEHFVKFMNSFFRKYVDLPAGQEKTRLRPFDKNIPFDLLLAYTRLGFLYEKKGDQKRSTENYNKAFEIGNNQKLFEKWVGTAKDIKTVEDLKKFVVEVDNRHRKGEK
mgnify:CR=1 FL=1